MSFFVFQQGFWERRLYICIWGNCSPLFPIGTISLAGGGGGGRSSIWYNAECVMCCIHVFMLGNEAKGLTIIWCPCVKRVALAVFNLCVKFMVFSLLLW